MHSTLTNPWNFMISARFDGDVHLILVVGQHYNPNSPSSWNLFYSAYEEGVAVIMVFMIAPAHMLVLRANLYPHVAIIAQSRRRDRL